MSDHELKILEEKLEQLIHYCEGLREDYKNLAKKNDDLSAKLSEAEENLIRLNSERENIRNRVVDLISKIDQLGPDFSENIGSLN
ncbi:MAG: cell division protein ZapB [Dissulfurimicrobium sp.]|uniref:cell division protein ZapB n=1 Tax=Dissulfurimicrobium sp. TaxID=2022436 RepID=UPI00404AE8B2